MPVKDQTHILANYSGLMEEIKTRLSVVRRIVFDGSRGEFAFESYILGELCHLQLRMICETIALGCLLVHGDIAATRAGRMQKAYAADWIINRLAKLNPDFYPIPGEHHLKDGFIEITPPTRPFLTKEKLLNLYNQTARFLHRGTLEGILSPDPKEIDINQIAIWAAEIRTLLDHHLVSLIDPRHQLFVVMQSEGDGKVRTFVVERMPGSPPSSA
jgi:hypothetical protein